MKLVTNGEKWAIRRGWLDREYFDFYSPGYWWSRDCRFGASNEIYLESEVLQELLRFVEQAYSVKIKVERDDSEANK